MIVQALLLAVLALLMKEPQSHVPKVARQHDFRADTMKLLRIPSFLLNTAAMTAMTFAIGGISFWIPKYMTLRVADPQSDHPLIFEKRRTRETATEASSKKDAQG